MNQGKSNGPISLSDITVHLVVKLKKYAHGLVLGFIIISNVIPTVPEMQGLK